MKKITFLFFLSTFCFVLTLSAQSWTAGNSNLYANPTTTRVGIGTMSPAYPLHVNGKIFLESVDVLNDWGSSYLHWNSHSLVMGTPAGHYAHNSVDLKPGGVTQEPLISQFRMFTATGLNQHELKIDFNTGGNCVFNNPGNVGIGTTSPTAKLTVNGNGLFSIPGTTSMIQGLTVNIETFYNIANSQQSYFLKLRDLGASEDAFLVRGDGNVGIGTSTPAYKLDVDGTVRAREVRINLNSGADFVFEDNYNLMNLNDLNRFIEENKHLPDIPSAEEMTSGDTDMGEMQVKLLQKIEELTLHIIGLEKRIKELEIQK